VAGTSEVYANELYWLYHMTRVGNLLYFIEDGALWRSDGTAAGTWLVKEIASPIYFNIKTYVVNNQLYIASRVYDAVFNASYEIWRTDGTAAGTQIEQVLSPHPAYYNGFNFVGAGSHVLFQSYDTAYGSELWGWDQGVDTSPPAITTPAPISRSTSDPSGAPVTYAVRAADNYDAAPALSCAPPSGSTFPVGVTTVSCTASDLSGNIASAAFTVTVTLEQTPDTTPPVISLPSALSVTTGDPAGAAVQYTATVSDTVDPSPSLSCAPPSGSTFPVGATTVTCTASDASGNRASAAFTVTVALRQQLYLPLLRR
jgi:ELWxxDGT repeat protein